jgi:hypothetical protein
LQPPLDPFPSTPGQSSQDSYPDPPAVDPPQLQKLCPLGPGDPSLQYGLYFDRCCAKFLLCIVRSVAGIDRAWAPTVRFGIQLDSYRDDTSGSSVRLASSAFLLAQSHYSTMWCASCTVTEGSGTFGDLEVGRPLQFFHILYLLRRAHSAAMLHERQATKDQRRSLWGNVVASLLVLAWDKHSASSRVNRNPRQMIQRMPDHILCDCGLTKNRTHRYVSTCVAFRNTSARHPDRQSQHIGLSFRIAGVTKLCVILSCQVQRLSSTW